MTISKYNIKRLRFEKVAAKRVEKILHYLDLLGNCSNRNNYEFTNNDVEKMFKEIQKAVSNSKNRFEIELSKKNKRFKF
jgi:GTP cyclohydrolase I